MSSSSRARARRRRRGVRLERARRAGRGARRSRVRAPRAAVGDLDRAEELLLHPVGGLLVEAVVGLGQRRERHADLLGRAAMSSSSCCRASAVLYAMP